MKEIYEIINNFLDDEDNKDIYCDDKVKHIKEYIYIIIDVHGVTQWSRPIGYSDQPMTNRDFPVSH